MNVSGNEEFRIFSRVRTMLVFLMGQDEGGLYGCIASGYLKESVAFHGAADLILKIDEICDRLEVTGSLPMGTGYDTTPQAMRALEALMVSIEYRQNASIQGRIKGRMTDGQYVSFRSALELLRMLQMIELSRDGAVRIAE